jgi:hypothetical protein
MRFRGTCFMGGKRRMAAISHGEVSRGRVVSDSTHIDSVPELTTRLQYDVCRENIIK